jgi:RNA polymerase sigma-70 factor (ECF subfamily)
MDMNINVIEKPPDTPLPGDPDSLLVAQLRAGDLGALEILMRRHNQLLFRIARSILREDHEAMDVVQETYVKAWYELRQFRGPGGFASWLSRIATNDAMMRVRKAKRMEYTIDDPDHEPVNLESSDPQPLEAIANQQLRKLLEEAIDKLPVNYRCVYVMRAVQQLSTAETALSLDITEDVVKTRFLRAKRSLQKMLASHLKSAELEVFEFAGHRCDAVVRGVLAKLRN